MSIDKSGELSGCAPRELTPELYRSCGLALGRRVEPQAKFVIGGDARPSTPECLAALAEGLCQAGAGVVDLGVLPTPMVYYAKRRLRAAGCAVVAASHDPAAINGLEWMIGEGTQHGDEVEALRAVAGNGAPRRSRRKPGARRELDISYDYVAWLQETWVESIEVERRIVLDPRHGCCSRRARRYLQAVFPRSLFSAIHDEPDPAGDGVLPSGSRCEWLGELAAAVDHAKADLGIAFDGDGDRVAFVDHEGTVLTAEEAACVLLHSFNGEALEQPFVYDVRFSQRLAELARQLGAQPMAERSGHGFLGARMRESRAFFGADTDGRYFFRALEGGDDGLFTACWLIAWLAHRDSTLAELRHDCPPVFMTPDLYVPAEAQQQQVILRQVQAAWSEYPQTLLDGVRIEYPDGWALVRSSGTEPSLVFRFESSSWSKLRDLVWRFCESLSDVGDELWMQYSLVLGGGDTCAR